MNIASTDRVVLDRQLHELAGAIEELLRSGLTAASGATRETLDVTFREASRLKLLRLAATLRAANEELGRYIGKQPEFNAKRLSFFLNRGWLLARGLQQALAENDSQAWERLLWTAPTQPVARVDVVAIGVTKKVAKGSFCAFEFRLRNLDNNSPAPQRLTWSCIFPMKPGVDIVAEAFLHLPHKQKFKASVFLEGKTLTLTNIMIATDPSGSGRITLTDSSSVTPGESFGEWSQFAQWSPLPFRDRMQLHEPSPFDLEVELQDEVVVKNWRIAPREETERDGVYVFPLTLAGSSDELDHGRPSEVTIDAIVSSGADGEAVLKRLDSLAKQKDKLQATPLLGLMHFDHCRCVLQPLTLFTPKGLELMTITSEKIDTASLLKTLKF